MSDRFSEMCDNGNVLLEILLLPGKLIYLATWKSTCRSWSCQAKTDFHFAGVLRI